MRIVFFSAMLAGALGVQAFVARYDENGNALRWDLTAAHSQVHPNVLNPNTKAIRFFMGADAYSTANREAELNAVRASFDQWEAIPGTRLRFEEGGLMHGKLDVDTADNTNVVFWVKGSTVVNGGFDNIFGSIAVTFFDYFADHTLAEADIVLNGERYTWFTDFTDRINAAQFVESAMLHEIGHFLGLDHSPVGGASMLSRGATGVNTQAGLSSDEIAAARALYPDHNMQSSLGQVRGQVTLNGRGIKGAAVLVEDMAGNIVAGTVSRANGTYELPGLPAGMYQIRTAPLDPSMGGSLNYLLRGVDIHPDYGDAETGFLPGTPSEIVLRAGGIVTRNVSVAGGQLPFRITRIGHPSSLPGVFRIVNTPGMIELGTSAYVGVYSPNLPASGADFIIPGDGITVGTPLFQQNASPGLHLIYAEVTIAEHATPGLRSLVIKHAGQTAYANGFLEILPPFPDFNFDGLDDYFQRKYFPLFTAPEAGPDADPDQDGFSNYGEYLAGTNPVDASSVLRIDSVRTDASGTVIGWKSAPGKRYQVQSRAQIVSRGWETSGTITAAGSFTEFLDPAAIQESKFYRVRAVP
jgi:hypothetical protein